MNWPQIISDLLDCGMTRREIRDEARIKPSFLSGLEHGTKKDPRFSTGLRLLELHQRRAGTLTQVGSVKIETINGWQVMR